MFWHPNQRKVFTAWRPIASKNVYNSEWFLIQDVKNARNTQKKTTKNLEKERGRLKELQAAPEKHRGEITKMEAKLVTLEVRCYRKPSLSLFLSLSRSYFCLCPDKESKGRPLFRRSLSLPRADQTSIALQRTRNPCWPVQ